MSMSTFFLDDNESLSVNWVYDDLNDAHEHDLMHIVYNSIEFINEGDHEWLTGLSQQSSCQLSGW